MAFDCSPCHRGSTQSSGMACHWRFPSHNMNYKCSEVDRSLQLCIFAKTGGMTSPFRLQSQCKTCFLAPFLVVIWTRWLSSRCSGLYASVFCITATRVLYISLTSENTGKRGVSGLESTVSLVRSVHLAHSLFL
jgi:hypothetical protein